MRPHNGGSGAPCAWSSLVHQEKALFSLCMKDNKVN